MKKLLSIILVGMTAALVFTGCKQSSITNKESEFIPDGAVIQMSTDAKWTMPETSQYTIPENAETGENGGPGAMATTAVDYSYYPASKQPVAAEPGDENTTLVIIYRQTDLGLDQDFDAVDVCDADSLIASMAKCGAFKAGTKVVEFKVDGDTAYLKLDTLSLYPKHDEKVVVQGIANTFIDNLGMKEIDIVVGEVDFGAHTFSSEYDS